MNAIEVVMDQEICTVLKIVEQRTVAFLRDELGMEAVGVDHQLLQDEAVILRAVTAIVGVGSRAGLYIAYSYDATLIRAMTKAYTAELSYAPEDEALYMRETASDIVNVIVGNCTAELAKRGELITLSPPVLMVGARTIQGRPKTAIAAVTFRFPEGALDVAFVGPKLLFDDYLNYRGEV
ncbi:MAG TPA: chemotaxis protein CheX [Rhizomicrobium sp.]|jgi:CheY-specific phosphatase CheX